MNYDSAHNQIDANALVNRFGFPPLVKGEKLEDFKRELRRYINVFGTKDGIHWQDVWDHLIATWRLNRYTDMKAQARNTMRNWSSPVFAKTIGTFGIHAAPFDSTQLGGEFASEDEIVDALRLADAEGNDVMLALDCLIAHARAEQIRMSARLDAHYRNGRNIIDVEWEEIK